MITLLGGAGRLPSTSELTQTPVLLQAVLPWHFVWKLYGIKDVRISKHRVGRNCIFSFMGCSYLMNQDITMQGIFSSELSVHLTLSGLLSTTYIITHGKKCEKLTSLVQLPLIVCGFIHCRELNEKWASLLWKCQLPLCTMYSLWADLCSPLKMLVCLFVLRKTVILREKMKVSVVSTLILRKADCEAGICFRTRSNKMKACIFHAWRLKDSN